ncbi:MAG: OsmC family protein [Chlorobium sp.]
MHATVIFDRKMPISGINDKGHATMFDASVAFSGTDSAASPMETVLESLGACSMMDIISILRKMKKEPVILNVALDAKRSEEHPKVFTSIHLNYRLESPDCTQAELEKATRLSMETYCSVAAMLRKSGCAITWATELVRE